MLILDLAFRGRESGTLMVLRSFVFEQVTPLSLVEITDSEHRKGAFTIQIMALYAMDIKVCGCVTGTSILKGFVTL